MSAITESMRIRGRLIRWLTPAVVPMLAFSCSRGSCLDEYIPRREVVTPVLDMSVDLGRSAMQSEVFSVEAAGRYSANASLELRHGPQGAQVLGDERFLLAGTASISPVTGAGNVWHRKFKRALTAAEVGIKLFEFEIGEENVGSEQRFTITLQLSPEFREHYSSMSVYVRRELKHSILD